MRPIAGIVKYIYTIARMYARFHVSCQPPLTGISDLDLLGCNCTLLLPSMHLICLPKPWKIQWLDGPHLQGKCRTPDRNSSALKPVSKGGWVTGQSWTATENPFPFRRNE